MEMQKLSCLIIWMPYQRHGELRKSANMGRIKNMKYELKKTKYIRMLQLVKKKRKLLQVDNNGIIARTARHK